MRIIFMGTPDFAVGALSKIAACPEHEVVLVVTQPDRPKGRGKELAFSPVKEKAIELGIDVFQPEKIKTEDSVSFLKTFEADIFVVAAFGQMLSAELLDMPKYGCVNIHASLLPRFRGASPIQAAVLAGEKVSGVTIQQMALGCDTGDIILQKELELSKDETTGTLFDRLSILGSDLIIEALKRIEAGDIKPVKQDESLATGTSKISKSYGHIDWSQSAEQIDRLIRGMNPWPCAYSFLENKKSLKIWKAEPVFEASSSENGVVDETSNEAFYVACDGSRMKILEVQLEGKRRMPAADFLRGNAIKTGDKLN